VLINPFIFYLKKMLKQGYPTKHHQQATKRYCQYLELRDDAALIEEYCCIWIYP
jgi:hypothetical protein